MNGFEVFMQFLGVIITIGSFVYAAVFLWPLGRPRSARTAIPYDMQALRRKYAKYQKVDSLLTLFVALPMAVAVAWGFVESMAALSYWYWRPEGTVVAKTMNWGIWIIPSIFYAIPVLGARAAFFWRLWFRKDFAEWMDYGVLTSGIDLRAAMRMLIVVCVLVATLITLGLLNSASRVTPQSLFVRSAVRFGERQYALDRISEIRRTKTFIAAVGREIPDYTSTFKDGATWSTQGWPKEVNPAVLEADREFVEYISRQSSVPIQ